MLPKPGEIMNRVKLGKYKCSHLYQIKLEFYQSSKVLGGGEIIFKLLPCKGFYAGVNMVIAIVWDMKYGGMFLNVIQ